MTASSDSKLRTLASYAAWTFGGQVALMLLQLGYAAVTSRLVPDTGFGAVAVAMSLSAFVTLFAQGGLGQATARTHALHPGTLSFLMLFSIGLGIVAMLLLVLLARPWAVLWNAPDAVGPIRLIGLAAFLAPLSGLLLGVLRRLGEFRGIAFLAVATSAAGMAIGVVAVIHAPGPIALLVSPVVSSALLTIAALVLTRGHWWAKPDAGAAQADLGFAWRVLGLTILSYVSGNIGPWSVSRWIGSDVLGQWNRANVLTAVPMNQAMTALSQAVYPEFRHDIGVQSRTRQAWTDYLLLVAWVFFPAAAILAAVAPFAVETLLGPGWGLAAGIAPLVAIYYGIGAVDTALANALESVGRFRLLVSTALTSLAVIVVGAVVTKVTGFWTVAPSALIAAALFRHILQVVIAARFGSLDGRSIARGYCFALVCSAFIGVAVALVLAGMFGRIGLLSAIAGAIILGAALLAGIAMRRHLPPVQILARYRSRASAS